MANVHLSYDQVRNSAAQLKKGQEDITAELVRLRSMVENLVNSDFVTDQASKKFDESYRQWTTGAKNVIDGLQGMNGFLTTAISKHEQLDAELGQAAGR